MSYRTNRRTLKPFPVTRKRGPTLQQLVADLNFQGRYADQIRFLREHGFANYDDRVTPDGYIHERWMNNFGDIVTLKISRPSETRMEDATIVNADFIPASKNVKVHQSEGINPQEMFARMEEVRGGYAVIYNPKTGRHRVAQHPEGEMSYEEAVAEAKERRKNAR